MERAANGQGAATRWAKELVAWAEARTAGNHLSFPQPPHAATPPPDDAIDEELKSGRIPAPSRHQELAAFARFVAGESHGLVRFAGIPGYLSQQGYNSARAGPIADRAGERIRRGVVRYALLRAPEWRPPYLPRPAALRILEGNFYQIATTPDCSVALGSEYEGAIWLWDLGTGAVVTRFVQPDGKGGTVDALAITPDARWAAAGDGIGQLRLWNLRERSCSALIEAPRGALQSITLAPDASWAVTSGADGLVRVWDLQRLRMTSEIPVGAGVLRSVATADGSLVVLGGQDGMIQVLALPDGREIKRFPGHDGPVGAMAITPDGRRLITGGQKDGTVRLWDPLSGAALQVFEGQSTEDARADRYVGAVNLTPDGRLGISGGEDTLVRVWDLEAGRCIKVFSSHTDTIISVAIAADGSRAVSSTACDDPTIRVWDLTGYDAPRGHGYRGNIWGLSLSADARVAATVDQQVRIWDLKTGTSRPLAKPKGRDEWVALTADGGMAAYTDGGRVFVCDAATGAVQRELGGEDHAERVALSPDGRWLLAGPGLRGTSLMTWDLERNDYRLLLKLPSGYGGTHELAFSRDGRLVFARVKAGYWAWRVDTGDRVECPDRVVEGLFGSAPGSLPGGRLLFQVEDQVLSLFHGDPVQMVAAVDVLSTIFSTGTACSVIAAGDRFGALHVFHVYDADPGVPRVTAVHRFRLDLGTAEPEARTVCPRCAGTFVSPKEILEVARGWCGRLGPSEIPCLDLPDEAFMDPRLFTRCPSCKAALLFEPYVAGEGGPDA